MKLMREDLVRYLKLSNKSNQKILVLESELITGNALKQDRVVDRTTLFLKIQL